jgi:hypothetical protein
VYLPEKLIAIGARKHGSSRGKRFLHLLWIVVFPNILGRFLLKTIGLAVSLDKCGLITVSDLFKHLREVRLKVIKIYA